MVYLFLLLALTSSRFMRTFLNGKTCCCFLLLSLLYATSQLFKHHERFRIRDKSKYGADQKRKETELSNFSD